MESEAERRQSQFQCLHEVRGKAPAEGRAMDDERLERLALLLDGRRPDADLLAIHMDSLPALFFFGRLVLAWSHQS